MTTSVLVADGPALRINCEGECRRTTPVPPRSAPLLFGLSLAAALPSAAWVPPPHSGLRAIHPTLRPILDSLELQTALGRPVAEVGRGRIALGDVDRRLHGLSLALDVLRADVGRDALVTIGVVSPDRAMIDGGATPAGLWALAREAIPWHGRSRGCRLGTAADSIVVIYGCATSQVAWLAADSLATVSVTDLDGDEEQRTELAHTLACRLAPRLASGMGRR